MTYRDHYMRGGLWRYRIARDQTLEGPRPIFMLLSAIPTAN